MRRATGFQALLPPAAMCSRGVAAHPWFRVMCLSLRSTGAGGVIVYAGCGAWNAQGPSAMPPKTNWAALLGWRTCGGAGCGKEVHTTARLPLANDNS
jgi:hypothetical protein